MKKVKDAVSGQTLRTTDPDESIAVAYGQMDHWGIHSLAVFEGGKFVGIVTMSDAARAMFGQGGDKVRGYMTKVKEVLFANPDDSLRKCGATMRKNHIHHLVVKQDDEVIAVISSLDLEQDLEDEEEEINDTARNMHRT